MKKGVRILRAKNRKQVQGNPVGIQVLPGTYKLRLTFGEQKDSAMINVKPDPRYPNLSAVIEARL